MKYGGGGGGGGECPWYITWHILIGCICHILWKYFFFKANNCPLFPSPRKPCISDFKNWIWCFLTQYLGYERELRKWRGKMAYKTVFCLYICTAVSWELWGVHRVPHLYRQPGRGCHQTGWYRQQCKHKVFGVNECFVLQITPQGWNISGLTPQR